jgi:hypothetical protein
VNKKRQFALILVLCAALPAGAQARRTFYVDAGAGLGANCYSFFNCINGKWELSESFFAGASAGYSPLLQWLYITGTFTYSKETNTLGNEAISLEIFNIAGGFRFYPFPSRKYFQLGLDIGAALANASSTVPGIPIPADIGTGFSVTALLAYDFSRSLTGPGLLAGSQISFVLFGSNWVLQTGLFVKVALKGLPAPKNAPPPTVDDTGGMVLAFPFAAVPAAWTACWYAYRHMSYSSRSHAP